MARSNRNWFCVVDLPRSGRENMRIDTALHRWVEHQQEGITVLRFYRWDVPTISLGRHQEAVQTLDENYCREHGLPIVHRPTGGRAVLHDQELTYSISSNDASLFPLGKIK